MTKPIKFLICHKIDYKFLKNVYAFLNTKDKEYSLNVLDDILPRLKQDEKHRVTYNDMEKMYQSLKEYDATNPYIKFSY